MPTLQLRTRGPARTGEVWERYAVLARWSEWAPQIRGVHATAGRIAPGVTGRVQGPGPVRVAFEVTAVDEAARTWSWRVRLGPVRLTLDHEVRPDAEDTLTTLAITGPTLVLLGYAPVAQLALRRLVH